MANCRFFTNGDQERLTFAEISDEEIARRILVELTPRRLVVKEWNHETTKYETIFLKEWEAMDEEILKKNLMDTKSEREQSPRNLPPAESDMHDIACPGEPI